MIILRARVVLYGCNQQRGSTLAVREIERKKRSVYLRFLDYQEGKLVQGVSLDAVLLSLEIFSRVRIF